MSNKTQLQTNNTKLDALITRVNAAKDIAASLPEAGGAGGSGGGLETVTTTITQFPDPGAMIYYINGDMDLCIEELIRGNSYTFLKNSLFYVQGATITITNTTKVFFSSSHTIYQATGE